MAKVRSEADVRDKPYTVLNDTNKDRKPSSGGKSKSTFSKVISTVNNLSPNAYVHDRTAKALEKAR
jgi:hypothetical protein